MTPTGNKMTINWRVINKKGELGGGGLKTKCDKGERKKISKRKQIILL